MSSAHPCDITAYAVDSPFRTIKVYFCLFILFQFTQIKNVHVILFVEETICSGFFSKYLEHSTIMTVADIAANLSGTCVLWSLEKYFYLIKSYPEDKDNYCKFVDYFL